MIFILPKCCQNELPADWHFAAKMKLHMSCYLRTAISKDFYLDGSIVIMYVGPAAARAMLYKKKKAVIEYIQVTIFYRLSIYSDY